MAHHTVEICGINTSELIVLKHEDMIELFKKYKLGDLTAKEQLVNGNLRLVLAILKRFNNRSNNLDDLFQIGCIGLIKAIDNFDINYEVRFSTYAVPMILGEIKRYLRDNSSVKVTRNLKDIAYKGLKVKELLTNKYNREPTNLEIARTLEIDEQLLIQAFQSVKYAVSMFEPIYSDGGDVIYLFEQLKDESDTIGIENHLALKEAIKKLSKKEKYIIIKRFFEGMTQIELSNILGISQAQISRLEKNGLQFIKKMIK